MNRRGQLQRESLIKEFTVSIVDDDQVTIICPQSISQAFRQHLLNERILASPPRTVVNGSPTDDEIVATLSEAKALEMVTQFVMALPFLDKRSESPFAEPTRRASSRADETGT